MSLSYAVDMWDGLDKVQSHESDVRKQMEDARKMVMTRSEAATAYGKSLVSLGAGGPGVEWLKAASGSHRKGEEALKQGVWIEKELATPLKKWSTDTKPVVDDLAKKGSELRDRFEEHRKAVADSLAAYHAAADKGEKAMREAEWAEKNKLLDPKERKRIETNWATLQKDWKDGENRTRAAVDAGNVFRTHYIEHMSSVLKGYETVELNRLTISYRTIEEYRKMDPPVTADPLTKPQDVQQEWIAANRTGLVPPPPFEFVPYTPKHPVIPYVAPGLFVLFSGVGARLPF